MHTTRSTRTFPTAVAALLAVIALLAPTAASAESLDIDEHRNHVGICHTPLDTCDFDGVGYGYHAAALRLAGVEGGSAVEADGITYTWPDVPAGTPDNVTMINQVIDVPDPGDATRIGFLGAAHHGPVGGEVTLHYATTDAEGNPVEVAQTHPLRFSDWTLNGGGADAEPGNEIAITTAFRAFGPAVMPTTTYVFAVDIELDPTMTLTAVELGRATSIRLFDIALA